MLMKFHGTLIISLMILIYVIRNGGSDHQIAPSKRVNIHTKKGIVKVFWMASYPYSKRRKEETLN
jgi:hypothetical protein